MPCAHPHTDDACHHGRIPGSHPAHPVAHRTSGSWEWLWSRAASRAGVKGAGLDPASPLQQTVGEAAATSWPCAFVRRRPEATRRPRIHPTAIQGSARSSREQPQGRPKGILPCQSRALAQPSGAAAAGSLCDGHWWAVRRPCMHACGGVSAPCALGTRCSSARTGNGEGGLRCASRAVVVGVLARFGGGAWALRPRWGGGVGAHLRRFF
eukprot:365479-Chlamydomonas_euryale.AAC.6